MHEGLRPNIAVTVDSYRDLDAATKNDDDGQISIDPLSLPAATMTLMLLSYYNSYSRHHRVYALCMVFWRFGVGIMSRNIARQQSRVEIEEKVAFFTVRRSIILPRRKQSTHWMSERKYRAHHSTDSNIQRVDVTTTRPKSADLCLEYLLSKGEDNRRTPTHIILTGLDV